MAGLTVDEVRQVLDYDPSTGRFTWKVARTNNVKVGKEAGCISFYGYRVIRIGQKLYRCNRLAWLYVTGSWPDHVIDHINGCRSDDRFENLRDVPISVNQQNRRKAQVDNKSGLLGVSKKKGKWFSRVKLNGKQVYLGTFETPELAHEAYLIAKRQLHVGCSI